MSEKMMDICTLDARNLARLYRAKELSPVDVVHALLAAAEQKRDYNLFITMMDEVALRMASEAEDRMMRDALLSPLDGVPFAVKDVICAKGYPTTQGCQIYKNFVTDYNATAVDKMQEAGAVLMGKLNTHQFALGATGDRTIIGPARNPRNPQKICGGSSSGSGGAVAAGLVPISLGTDTGGSMRNPSAFCGVIGMKATYGRTSIHGVMPVSKDLDHVGPHTRTVYDNAVTLNALAGYDPKDDFSIDLPVCPDYTRGIGKPINGAVIGVLQEECIGPIQSGVLATVKSAIATLQMQGAIIKEIKLPDKEDWEAYRVAHQTMLLAEVYTVHERDILENSALIAPEVLQRMKGGNISASEYIRSIRSRPKFRNVFRELMRDIDILMTPMMPAVAIDLETREVNLDGKMYSIYEPFTRFTWFGNFAGIPALSMPCGEVEGLPVGVQMIGHPWREDEVYRFASALETALS